MYQQTNNSREQLTGSPRRSNPMFHLGENAEDSYGLMNDNEEFGGKWYNNEDRLGFIRKVYGIMASQLILTAFVTLLPYSSPNIRLSILSHPGIALFFGIMGLFLSCALFCI